MSKVVFLLHDVGPNRLDVIKTLRSAFGVGLQEISHATSTAVPLIERHLFDRKEPAFPGILLALMSQLQALGASFTVYQVLDHQSFDPSGKYYEVTIDRLRNLIDSREESLQEQRTLGGLEDGSS